LKQLLGSGKAHLTNPASADGWPEKPERWGWRKADDRYEPQGTKIGWVLPDGIYLYAEPAVDAAKELAQQTGDPLPISAQAINRRLYDRGWLLSTDVDKARKSVTVRRTVQGETGTFLHCKREYLGENG
jgi:hypothetical protein